MEKQLKYKVLSFQNAVHNLQESLELNLDHYDKVAVDSIKSGQIQKFEFSVELLWKTLKFYLREQYGEDVKTPKTVIKKTLELEIIDYTVYEKAIDMINWRNELSHVYSQDHFEELRIKILDCKYIWEVFLNIF